MLAATSPSPADRRQYPRVPAPIICQPAKRHFPWPRRRVKDISQSGLRTYTDEPMSRGERLELDLLPPDGPAIGVEAEVVWIQPLPDGAPALFDVGMHFTRIARHEQGRLAQLLAAAVD